MGTLRLPHLRNRFRVSFCSQNDKKLEFSDSLSSQILSVLRIHGPQPVLDLLCCAEPVTLIVEDDVDNIALSAILQLNERGSDATVMNVEMLDGDNRILRTMKFFNIRIFSIKHSDLNYPIKETDNSACQIVLNVGYDKMAYLLPITAKSD